MTSERAVLYRSHSMGANESPRKFKSRLPVSLAKQKTPDRDKYKIQEENEEIISQVKPVFTIPSFPTEQRRTGTLQRSKSFKSPVEFPPVSPTRIPRRDLRKISCPAPTHPVNALATPKHSPYCASKHSPDMMNMRTINDEELLVSTHAFVTRSVVCAKKSVQKKNIGLSHETLMKALDNNNNTSLCKANQPIVSPRRKSSSNSFSVSCQSKINSPQEIQRGRSRQNKENRKSKSANKQKQSVQLSDADTVGPVRKFRPSRNLTLPIQPVHSEMALNRGCVSQGNTPVKTLNRTFSADAKQTPKKQKIVFSRIPSLYSPKKTDYVQQLYGRLPLERNLSEELILSRKSVDKTSLHSNDNTPLNSPSSQHRRSRFFGFKKSPTNSPKKTSPQKMKGDQNLPAEADISNISGKNVNYSETAVGFDFANTTALLESLFNKTAGRQEHIFL